MKERRSEKQLDGNNEWKCERRVKNDIQLKSIAFRPLFYPFSTTFWVAVTRSCTKVAFHTDTFRYRFSSRRGQGNHGSGEGNQMEGKMGSRARDEVWNFRCPWWGETWSISSMARGGGEWSATRDLWVEWMKEYESDVWTRFFGERYVESKNKWCVGKAVQMETRALEKKKNIVG